MTLQLPEKFIQRINLDFGTSAAPFLKSLEKESPISIRINPAKDYKPEGLESVIWCENGFYLPSRPVFTLDPFFHAGTYYVQEASSMFLEQALKQTVDLSQSLKVLDLCAAPGGKSTHIASLLSADSLLVSNEVIRPRSKILAENLSKWGNSNVVVTNNDPSAFQRLQGFFDILVVDAPCSGEGLFRKDPGSADEWSEDNVNLCSARQRRILSDVWDTVIPGGIIIYSTCTYNRMENEENIKWMVEDMNAEPVEINIDSFEGITPSDNIPVYHFYPHKTKGEGFFISVLRKSDGKEFRIGKQKKPILSKINSSVQKEIRPWVIQPERYDYWSFQDKVLAFPALWANELLSLIDNMSIVQAGTEICEIKARNIIPSHALAVSTLLNKESFIHEEFDLKSALLFLKKEDTKPEGKSQYLLSSYKNVPLGWLKNAGNRYNNLYPKEWRIRMDI